MLRKRPRTQAATNANALLDLRPESLRLRLKIMNDTFRQASVPKTL
jgi:hypothetical protein